jgi:type IV secretory pathway protease TraF
VKAARAFGWSLLVPGLGLLTVGRPLSAFGLAALNVLAGAAWTLAWAHARFSFPLFVGVALALPVLSRVAAGALAAWAARTAGEPRPWQRPLTYGTFCMLFLFAGAHVDSLLEERVVRKLGTATPVLEPEVRGGQGMWLLRVGASAAPRRGALAAFHRPGPKAEGLLQRPERPLLGRVAAVGGDTVEITAQSVRVNGRAVADAGADARPWPSSVLAEGQVLLLAPRRDVAAGDRDSRDLGPLRAEHYLGEVALVLGAGSPAQAVAEARWLAVP